MDVLKVWVDGELVIIERGIDIPAKVRLVDRLKLALGHDDRTIDVAVVTEDAVINRSQVTAFAKTGGIGWFGPIR